MDVFNLQTSGWRYSRTRSVLGSERADGGAVGAEHVERAHPKLILASFSRASAQPSSPHHVRLSNDD